MTTDKAITDKITTDKATIDKEVLLLSSVSSKPTLNLFSAILSVFVPGLGQLYQGRWKEALLFFFLFVLSGLFPFYGLYTSLFIMTPDFLILESVPFFLLAIFPLLTLFFAVLDASHFCSENPSFPLGYQVKWLVGVFVWISISLFFIVPFISCAREAARRMECTNHLKKIAMAMHEYHDFYGVFPPAYTVDSQGNKLHSWRVLLLPYLGEMELYKKIRLDEPWSSDYNRQFHRQGADLWQCPSQKKGVLQYVKKSFPQLQREENNCSYSVIIGPNTIFPETNPVSMCQLEGDTILVIERMVPVCWMNPTLEFQFDNALHGINSDLFFCGSVHHGGCNAVKSDGSVTFLSCSIDPKLFESLLTVKKKK